MLYRNICLIGLPYSGKTQIGRLLYKHLNKGFIDTDDIIISKYKTNLSNIISKYGNQKYLEIEQDVIHSLTCKNTVISTGGSVIYESESMKYLKNELNSDIYHLFLSKKEFSKRATDLEKRGVVINKDHTIEKLYNERIDLYDKYSDKTISACRDINLDIFKHELYTSKTSNTDNYYWNPRSPSLVLPKMELNSRPAPPL